MAPADRSHVSAVLAAGGGTARLLAEAGSCIASSFAGAKSEAIGSELCVDPGVGRQSADVCLSLSLFRAHTTKYCKKKTKSRKERTKSYDILGKVQGTKEQPTDQRTNDNMFGPAFFRR